MENSAPLWDEHAETPKNLRLPNTSSTNLGLTDNIVKSDNYRVSNYVLSVEAAEWYPPGHPQATPTPKLTSVQERLKINKSSTQPQPSATENYINAYKSGAENERLDQELDERRLENLINTLSLDPGQFDSLVDIFMDTLAPCYNNLIAITQAIDMLVNRAISNPSFRYTCARLCYLIEQDCPEFRAQLHLKCKSELEKHSNKQGILLFVAELYTQLHHENIYGTCLLDALKNLLSAGGDDNIKTVCQALKLTGYSLDRYDSKAVDSLFDQLKNVRETASGTALSLLNSVINLRSVQWGHTNENLSSESDQDHFYWDDGHTSNTLFYNSDGNALTAEETAFLASNLQSTDYLIESSDSDELCDPEPEMDEEIQEAFKEFVKLSKR